MVGGKAHGLWLAIGRGLPVPPGIVLTGGARDVAATDLAALPSGRFAVRSSATFEDRPGVGAAGLLRTRLDVEVDSLGEAVDACRASANADHVRVYLTHRGVSQESLSVAVIVQAMVGPGRRGLLASRDPGGSGLARLEEGDVGHPRVDLVAREALADPFRRALALEEDLGGPVEIEWAECEGQFFLLQARPAPAPATVDPFPIDFRAPEDRARGWRWDREHNPSPLSPAHEGLVARVDRAAGGEALRVWNGYLYERDEPVPVAAPAPAHHDVARSLAALESERPAEAPQAVETLGRVVEAFAAFAPGYHRTAREARLTSSMQTAHVGPPAIVRDEELWRLGRAAAHVPGLLDHLRDPSRPAPRSVEMAEWFAELRGHLDRWGAFAPVWDLAAVPYGEDPRPLYPAILRLASDPISPLDRRSGRVEGASPRGEDDDLVYARALRPVRRALLAVGRAWVAAGCLDTPGDAFFLPLETMIEGKPPPDAREAAAAARALHEARRRIVPPLSVRGGALHFPRPAGDVLIGAGVGGRARGPAVVIRDAAAPIAAVPGAVVVVSTVSPTMTFLLATAAAVVTDHGGLLDHGAFMAREYGLPAVVGTFWATRVLRDGDEVVVDGTAGRVYALPSGPG